MLFNKEFDSSLYLLLKSDKLNRKEVIKFIKNIPDELILKIRNNLNNNEIIDCISDSSIGFNHEKYTYILNKEFLEISKSYDQKEYDKSVYTLMLQRLSKDKLDNFNNYGPIGVIEKEDSVEYYELIKSNIGYIIKHYNDYNDKVSNKRVMLSLIPKNIKIN